MHTNSSHQPGFFWPRFCLALVLGLVAVSLGVASLAVPTPPSGALSVKEVIPPKAAPGPVTITEFSDFQCPYCKRAASVVQQVRQTYGNRVKVIFKQLPLSFHQYAFKAAQASVCAQEQGAFWQYHDRLFASSDLSTDALNRIAAEVGLKQNVFNQCMASEISRALVEEDIAEANRLGVRGTPTFFVNGTPLRGAASFAALKQEIDGAMLGVSHPVSKRTGPPTNAWQALRKNAVSSTLALIQQAALTPLANQQQAAATSMRTADGVTLSPASINFGYQMVGTTGPQFTETVTNSGTAPLTITDISVSGRDRRDFVFTYTFSLPVTVAPGNNVTINFNFNPLAPWRPGTRDARLEISERRNSQYLPLTGIGATCLGPVPACSSGCPDSDSDGLNDAWEIAGGIDIDNDGVIDASKGDVLLPGADPSRPDIYLKYDYMVAADHSHEPPASAFDQMIAMFANHGINLHVVAPGVGIPEHQVTTLDPNAQPNCAGTDFITMQQLRAEYFGNLKYAYHYMVFAHDSTTPSDGSLAHNCPGDLLCGGKPAPGASGMADVFGDDSIISFGYLVDIHQQIGIELWTNAMMHELGHNFGLGHGSLADPGNTISEYCLNYKPNYISVMNYDYELNTLVPAIGPGSTTPISCNSDADCGPPNITRGRCSAPNSCFCTDDLGEGKNVCYRPDYAEDQLLNLNETTLNENVGVGGPSTLEDIVWYYYGAGTLAGPSNGSPIDWNNDGFITNLTGCVGLGCPDVNNNGSHSDQMDTTADWTQVNGQFVHLDFQFQCTPGYLNDNPGSRVASPTQE